MISILKEVLFFVGGRKKVDKKLPAFALESYSFCSEGFTHICQSIKMTSMAKTTPKRTPPGMCNQKKAGWTNSLSQTEDKSMITPMKGSIISQIRAFRPKSRNRTIIPIEDKNCTHAENVDVSKSQCENKLIRLIKGS